jgi:hypothetical protein
MKYFLLVLTCCTMLAACKKRAVCRGNCVDIRITGRLYDGVTNAGLPSQPVQLWWEYLGYCLFCSDAKITDGRTNANGDFDFSATIDTTVFNNRYYLVVRALPPLNYLNDAVHPSIFGYNPSGLMNLKISMSPKADISIQLHRTMTDTFRFFSVTSLYRNPYGQTGATNFVYNSGSRGRDTTINMLTSAGVYTVIEWYKSGLSGTYLQQGKDSLVCTTAGPNIFNISY